MLLKDFNLWKEMLTEELFIWVSEFDNAAKFFFLGILTMAALD